MNMFKRLIMCIGGWLLPPKTLDTLFLNQWSASINLPRHIWKEKPDIKEWKFRYEEVYLDQYRTKLLYKYIETDESLQLRIKESYIK